jgi:ABC-type multidrug transport system ATPase subunit
VTGDRDPGRGLVLTAVSRRFAGRTALAPLDLAVRPGAVCLVTGANGSGKTTLLRVAAGLLPPSAGVRDAPRPGVYLRPSAGGRRTQSVVEAVASARVLAGGSSGVDVATAVQALGLEALARQRVSRLSAGERARLSLAVALVVQAPLVCLDEPTEHLDADGQERAVAVVQALAAAGAAVLVATHHPAGLDPVVDAVLTLSSGVAVTA